MYLQLRNQTQHHNNKNNTLLLVILNHIHSWQDKLTVGNRLKSDKWKNNLHHNHIETRNQTSLYLILNVCHNINKPGWSTEGNIRTWMPNIRQEIPRDGCPSPKPWVMFLHLEWRSTPEKVLRSCSTCECKITCREYTKLQEVMQKFKIKTYGIHHTWNDYSNLRQLYSINYKTWLLLHKNHSTQI